jgi:hypothetical protein
MKLAAGLSRGIGGNSGTRSQMIALRDICATLAKRMVYLSLILMSF